MNFGKSEYWLNRRRLRFYSRILMMLFILLFIGLVRYSNLVEPNGYTFNNDTTVFWGASYLALAGRAVDAYNITILSEVIRHATEIRGFAWSSWHFGWCYPPTFHLIILPLALLPYFPAYLAFMLSTLSCYVLVLWRIIRDKDSLWLLAGFPALWSNFLSGQNGFLTAALAGAALLNLERRPVLAGVFIGLLSIKPHLGLLFPLALIAIGAWRTFFTAAITMSIFMWVSTAILGADTFAAWLHSLGLARQIMEGPYYWASFPTMFSFLRLLGVPVMVAYMGHALVALGAITAMWKVWRHCPSWPLRGSALITATFLTSPYLLIYDLTWLALPIAWLVKLGLQDGWLRGEREVLVLAWLLSLLSFLIAKTTNIQIGPWVLLALLWVVLRRSGTMSSACSNTTQNDP